MTRRVLVAGIGNIFMGDDAFGVEVAARLSVRPLPEGVTAVDFGIRAIHLAYELLEGYNVLVLIDAMDLGEPPGTLAMVEPDEVPVPSPDDPTAVFDAHTMTPGVILGLLDLLDAHVKRIVIVACQPENLEGIGLSPAVAESVGLTVDLLDEVLADICAPVAKEATA